MGHFGDLSGYDVGSLALIRPGSVLPVCGYKPDLVANTVIIEHYQRDINEGGFSKLFAPLDFGVI